MVNKSLNYNFETSDTLVYNICIVISISNIALNKIEKKLFLPLHRICHQELRKQLLEQSQDGTKELHPPQLVKFSPLKSFNLNKRC